MTTVAVPPRPVVREVLGPAPEPVAGVASHPLPLPTRRCAWLVAATSLPIVLGLVHPLFPLVGAIGVLVVVLTAVADWLALPAAPHSSLSGAYPGHASAGDAGSRATTAHQSSPSPGGVQQVAGLRRYRS